MTDYLIATGLVAATALIAWLAWRDVKKHRNDPPPSDPGAFL